jgi:threonine-phosphate decarboxylase
MTEGHGDDIYKYQDIRINFSSNVYTHADLSKLEEHLREMVGMIRNYPEPEPFSLEAVIARKYDIPTECVLVTSGATEAIYLIARTFALQQESFSASILHPTFSEYEDACRMYGIPTLPDNDANTHSILWLCNPNNPTGTVVSPEKIQQYAQQFDYVVVDQSYEDYTQAPMLIPQEAVSSDNILQLHSLTKTYAIPGLRIGYIIAPSHLIGLLRQYVGPWTVNALAIEAGKWLMENDVRVLPDINTYLTETERLRQRLNQIPGIKAAETQTNFFLAQVTHHTAAELKDYLARNHHILIRDASNFRGLTPHHFRISTQTSQENDMLVNAIEEFMQRKKMFPTWE